VGSIRSLPVLIDRASRTPVELQITEGIRRLIRSGHLAHGNWLPSTRALAGDLGIARSTLVGAYEQLVAEGYIEGRQGRGYFVCSIGEVDPASSPTVTPIKTEAAVLERGAPRMFRPGQPDTRLFPLKAWGRTVSRLARSAPQLTIASEHPFGDLRLRTAIAEHLAQWRHISASPDQIVVTAGSANALEICVSALSPVARAIGLENPGYPPLRRFVAQLGLHVEWLEVGSDGAELPAGCPDLVVLTPSRQFPMGMAMSINRRLDYLEWAERTGAWIIEDDYDSEYRYAGHPIPALAGLDTRERTFYVGSFSKTISPDLRLGFLLLPAQLAENAAAAINRQASKASVMPQRALALFMETGEYHRHIRRSRRHYAERRRHLMDQLQAQTAGFTLESHDSGLHVVIVFDDGRCDREIARRATEFGLGTAPLSDYYGGEPDKTGLLVGFAAHDPDEIRRHVPALRNCLAPE
jgi:GntR family transcriptional regulator / MocR family aminotransferase